MKIKQKITLFMSALALFVVPALAVTAPAYAAAADNTNTVRNALCKGANNLEVNPEGGTDTDCEDSNGDATGKVNSTITMIINVFSTVVGVVAVIMIIWGGLRYITSGGDSGKIGNAKNTIIYALLGLIIVALAQFIVRFVLAKATAD